MFSLLKILPFSLVLEIYSVPGLREQSREMGSPEEIMPGVFDWSVVHEPSSNRLFEPLERNGRADWGRFKLPEEQVCFCMV